MEFTKHPLMTAVAILQNARQGHKFGTAPYRVLDSAIGHLIGNRASSVDFIAPLPEVSRAA